MAVLWVVDLFKMWHSRGIRTSRSKSKMVMRLKLEYFLIVAREQSLRRLQRWIESPNLLALEGSQFIVLRSEPAAKRSAIVLEAERATRNRHWSLLGINRDTNETNSHVAQTGWHFRRISVQLCAGISPGREIGNCNTWRIRLLLESVVARKLCRETQIHA